MFSRILIIAAFVFATAILPASAQEQRLKTVATFSIIADLVKNVGGDKVEVKSLVPAGGDAHVYSPSPADAKTLSEARIVFTNGLGFEGWIARLVKSSATKADVVVLTKGVKPRKAAGSHGHGHSHGHSHDSDPHAWQSVANAKIYVANIREALSARDPANKAFYEEKAAAYLQQLDAVEREVRDAVAKIPQERRRIITSHDAFGYFAEAYGVQFVAPRGISTDAEPSAKDVARIITQIKQQKIPAVFLENISDVRLLQQIAAETGAKVGGTLYSDALTDEKGKAPTYLDLMRHNVRTLAAALAG